MGDDNDSIIALLNKKQMNSCGKMVIYKLKKCLRFS